MHKYFVTGATGFVGQALLSTLLESNYSVRALVRLPSSILPSVVEQVVGDLIGLFEIPSQTWNNTSFILNDIDVVLHTCCTCPHYARASRRSFRGVSQSES